MDHWSLTTQEPPTRHWEQYEHARYVVETVFRRSEGRNLEITRSALEGGLRAAAAAVTGEPMTRERLNGVGGPGVIRLAGPRGRAVAIYPVRPVSTGPPDRVRILVGSETRCADAMEAWLFSREPAQRDSRPGPTNKDWEIRVFCVDAWYPI